MVKNMSRKIKSSKIGKELLFSIFDVRDDCSAADAVLVNDFFAIFSSDLKTSFFGFVSISE